MDVFPNWVEYLDRDQKRYWQDQRGLRRLIGLSKEKLGYGLKWVTWKLWGKRRAIRRMKQLAFAPQRFLEELDPKKETQRIIEHREKLDSIQVPLPTPDTHDVN